MAQEHDGMTTRIGQVVILLHGGDREEARSRFAALWAELGEGGPPLHRCTLAHYMALAQDDPEEELAWDLRALRAADAVGGRPCPDGVPAAPVRGLYPSLHLSLAADYHRLGEQHLARGHLERARTAAGELPEDAHGDRVRAAIARLAQRLPAAGPGSDQSP